jgi:hypothetical protein
MHSEFGWKIFVNRSHFEFGQRWENDTLSDLKEIYFDNVNWIQLAQDRKSVLAVFNLQFLIPHR